MSERAEEALGRVLVLIAGGQQDDYSPRIVTITSAAVRVTIAGAVSDPCASRKALIQSTTTRP
ncbi:MULTISPECIES: hypothetical protein [Streptomyces]|uniref:Uncharacterized protein n=2 Tax=Streptomyces malaysiensis TaxID=92644 RepID=A0ABX6WM18_STRMQ|nr:MULTISPECIES: hypothetical protein [Streptomyces]PNG89581.1 hypothetical protein SMF913_25046 [Streptomyces malaysiensis]QPI61431.1 hypothetical protein I1A49_46905 [Streptomyces solisilvae]UHH23212.1 hypothetical protein LUV23_47065 [Streptomyces sp. HNM0561]WHX15585.1 hypothetical protein QFW82_00315 [Streptomyces sp. NA07423]